MKELSYPVPIAFWLWAYSCLELYFLSSYFSLALRLSQCLELFLHPFPSASLVSGLSKQHRQERRCLWVWVQTAFDAQILQTALQPLGWRKVLFIKPLFKTEYWLTSFRNGKETAHKQAVTKELSSTAKLAEGPACIRVGRDQQGLIKNWSLACELLSARFVNTSALSENSRSLESPPAWYIWDLEVSL